MELPVGRTKSWETGQAVLVAKAVLKTPFVVINADDYYGKEGFRLIHEYLVNGGQLCMAGFVLKNIVKTADDAEADGTVIDTEVPTDSIKAEFLIPTFI